jgi:tetratricopeptide (TPR) repeat protein
MRMMMLLTLFGSAVSGMTIVSAEDAKRFDHEVREDIFAGFNGDDEALARGLKKCDEAIAKDPKNAEAVVWRGAARVFKAGKLFGEKKSAEAFPLWTSGLKDLDDAVVIDPKSIAVRIPRAAVLMPAGRGSPKAMGEPLLKKARDDFEYIYKQQEKVLDKIGTHSRGELHMGLAEVYRRLGEPEKSKHHLESIVKDMANTKYAKRAEEWLAAKPDEKLAHNCIGCHTKK